VLGFDEDLLGMVPKPCAAVILLFPCSDLIYEARAREEQALRAQVPAKSQAFFLKQHAEFGNACGTIASVHALSNSRWAFETKVPAASSATTPGALASFCESQRGASADERGRALLAASELKCASDSAAVAATAQTACPDRDGPDLDHHFTAFVCCEGRLLELDGTKWAPVDHGACASDSVLEASCAAIQSRFMALEPGSIEFSLLALCRHEE
jgi:ubiquitin carboxyl-terminal hydrolase L3